MHVFYLCFIFFTFQLTHGILMKELHHLKDEETLQCNDSVKIKTKEYIRSYMKKFGPVYKRTQLTGSLLPAGSFAEERSSLSIGYMYLLCIYFFRLAYTSFKLFYGFSTFLYIYMLGTQFVVLVYNQGFYLLLLEPMHHEGRLEIQRT